MDIGISNKSIDRQMELDEILRRMKNQNSSLHSVKEQMRQQEIEEKK